MKQAQNVHFHGNKPKMLIFIQILAWKRQLFASLLLLLVLDVSVFFAVASSLLLLMPCSCYRPAVVAFQ
jgi:hypothetical protein